MSEANFQNTLILNVDDYLPGRYARTKLLKQAGYTVIEAGTGRETLELVDREHPALVLLDVNLPDISGFDVCRQLRDAEPRRRHSGGEKQHAPPTILHISASSVLSYHQVNGLESGADGYLVEPVEPAVLLATVNAYLRARRAEDELRKSNEELRWFAYRAGHDLNEPLRTLTAYAQLLKRRLGKDADPETLTLLDFIDSGSTKMRSFVDGLLEYSQASTAQDRHGAVDCETMLDRVLAGLDSALRESGAVVTRDPLPAIVASEQMEYVFQNLIANAIKYRKPDVRPEVHVSARRHGNSWVFSVTDNGIGIPEQYQNRIFDIFWRMHGNAIPGNGIGLALARKIVQGHGGAIRVESQEGCGSTFLVTIPDPIGSSDATATSQF